MKLKDLKSGQIVYTRNAHQNHMVVIGDRLVARDMFCLPLCIYNDDMLIKDEYREEYFSFDIIRVYDMKDYNMKDFGKSHFIFEPNMADIIWVREEIDLNSEQLKCIIETFNMKDWIIKDNNGQIRKFLERPNLTFRDIFDPIKRVFRTEKDYFGEVETILYNTLLDSIKPFDSPINIGELLENIHFITKLKEKGIV